MTTHVPTEAQEQEHLAAYLDHLGVLWCHVPNASQSAVQYRAKMARHGLKPGVPDILIFTPPPLNPGHLVRCGDDRIGCAIELKRAKGGVVSPVQREWLKALEHCGWCTYVARGAGDAIAWLTKVMGYQATRRRP